MYRFHVILFVRPILTVAAFPANASAQQRNVVVESAPPKTWAVVLGIER